MPFNRPAKGSKETVKMLFLVCFVIDQQKNSCVVTRSICSPMRESKQAAQPLSVYRRVWLEIGVSPGFSARWPAFYDGRNSNVGQWALTLGLIALQAQPCPDRAVPTKAWPDKVNNQQPFNYFRGREKTKYWGRFTQNKKLFQGQIGSLLLLLCINLIILFLNI